MDKSNGVLKGAYLSKQRELSKLVRKAKRNYARTNQLKLLEDQRKKPSAFWQYIKRLDSAPHVTLPNSIENSEGRLVENPIEVREEWKSYFKKLLNPTTCTSDHNISDDPPPPQRSTLVQEDSLKFLNEEISLEQL